MKINHIFQKFLCFNQNVLYFDQKICIFGLASLYFGDSGMAGLLSCQYWGQFLRTPIKKSNMLKTLLYSVLHSVYMNIKHIYCFTSTPVIIQMTSTISGKGVQFFFISRKVRCRI